MICLYGQITEAGEFISENEQRLGTQKMLPLIFSMSLPAVAAQLVNLLYIIIDRVYIGHIPGFSTDALTVIACTVLFAIKVPKILKEERQL